ncbi:MAG: type II secretion system protein [Chthoniobacteraceae bacterium]
MTRFRNTTQGFTLLEMLVATTILTLLIVIGMGAVNGTFNLASQATQRIDANRVARESLDEIGRELSVAAAPFNRQNTVSSVQLLIDPPNVLPAQAVANSDSMFWQAPLAHNRDYGNLAIVGYFVISDTTSANALNWRLQLRRVYIEPETSGTTANTNYLLYSGTNITTTGNTPWLTGAIAAGFAPSSGSSDVSNGLSGWVADGVLAMWVRCLDKSGNLITLNAAGAPYTTSPQYNSSTAYTSGSTSTYNPYSYPATSYTAMPAYVEVAIACFAPSEMARIKSLPAVPTIDRSVFLSGTGANSIPGYLQAFRSANPGVKSTEIFSRRFRIYSSD